MKSLEETITEALEGAEKTKQVVRDLYLENAQLGFSLRGAQLANKEMKASRDRTIKALSDQLSHITWLARMYTSQPHAAIKGIGLARLVIQAVSDAAFLIGDDIPF